MSTQQQTVYFPGETADYRNARNKLLQEEMELRRRIESVAALRRQLPPGGLLKEDYTFAGKEGAVKFSSLFAPDKDTLIVYNFMFGPKMGHPCTSCTSILDGLNGQAMHVTQRVDLAIVARSPLPRILQFAEERGWSQLRLLSSADNNYNRDYLGESEDGDQMPMLNVFQRRDGKIHHFYGSELLYTPSEPGQDGRHVDMIWPLWNVFDLTPEGRGTSWYPRLAYNG